MKRLLLIVVSVTALLPVTAQEKVDLEAIYQQIDEAIEQSHHYVAEYKMKVQRKANEYLDAQDLDTKRELAFETFQMYKGFMNDSALAYLTRTIDLSERTGRLDLANKARSLMARQCSNAGMYVEAGDILSRVDKSALSPDGLADYYDACMHLSGEIANYTAVVPARSHYYAERDHYRDSLLAVAAQSKDRFLHLEVEALLAKNQVQEALKVSDNWINSVKAGSHEEAFAAYYRHIIYARLGNDEMVKYWLAKSALDDIICGVQDQASIIVLAELLNYDGQFTRSYNYIRFVWECTRNFNTRMRTWQISPVLNVIEKSYQDSVERTTRVLVGSAVIFTLLTLALIVMFVYVSRQKKKLAKAQADLIASNERLSAANEKLTRMNERITKYNKQLFDVNYELRKEMEK